jgi:hypothetical protein
MATRANTTFDILSWDEAPCGEANELPTLARASTKVAYHGDIEAESISEGPMVYLEDSTASYLSMERVTGSINGRTGTFVLRATGVFADGAAQTQWEVVPGSGTGELRGLRGTGGYRATEGRKGHHAYLDYELP